MKFDCAKISGKIDKIGSVNRTDGGYNASVSIDSQVIPKMQMSRKIYEELNVGESVTLYGLFKNEKNKDKNEGILYGLKKENGEKLFATDLRYKVPMFLVVTAVIAFCFVFVAGWALSVVPVGYFMGTSGGSIMYNTTVVAVVEASLAAAFFLWRAFVMLQATADPEAWAETKAAVISARFSKFDK